MEKEIENALNNIGLALAHPSLMLSQKDHLSLIESFNIIKSQLTTIEDAKIKKNNK